VSAVDTLADKAEAVSRRLAGENGFKGKLAAELADDAVFLRKLKPSLMKQRARGRAPTDETPGEPRAPAGPRLGTRPGTLRPGTLRSGTPSGGGPNPFVVVGIAFAAGVALAKWIDWRGHAHPRW
jgi:hypothetical protein